MMCEEETFLGGVSPAEAFTRRSNVCPLQRRQGCESQHCRNRQSIRMHIREEMGGEEMTNLNSSQKTVIGVTGLVLGTVLIFCGHGDYGAYLWVGTAVVVLYG